MTERIIIAGSGGQGIMLLGKILAEAAMREARHVTWLPSYGAEVRGGTAHCMVVISDREIGSPYVGQADTLIIMNSPSLDKFQARVKNKGLLILNSSLAKQEIKGNAHMLRHPFTDMAVELGNIKVANMLALGCFIAKKKLVNLKTVFGIIADFAPSDKKDLIEINKQALKKGAALK
jgi:2-oxoglutarate ferredoxin oxidoreductase subunit gamma